MGIYDLKRETATWVDAEDYAQDIVDRFTGYVDADPDLKAHRDFIETGGYGFGERCFHWLWRLIIDEMPESFSMLEIGVYKGQVLSLVRLLADQAGKEVEVTGVTPLSQFSGVTGKFPKFPEGDYMQHITDLHDHFGQAQPSLVVGDSTDPRIQKAAAMLGPYDIAYIDGCHEYDYVAKDLRFYPNLVKHGGYLVVDDSANDLHQPWGFFQGIEDVSRAVRTIIETDPQWEHRVAVMHNRVWRRTLPTS